VELLSDDIEVLIINHLTTIVPMLTDALDAYRERCAKSLLGQSQTRTLMGALMLVFCLANDSALAT